MGGYGRVFEHSVHRETSDRKVAVKEEKRSVSERNMYIYCATV